MNNEYQLRQGNINEPIDYIRTIKPTGDGLSHYEMIMMILHS